MWLVIKCNLVIINNLKLLKILYKIWHSSLSQKKPLAVISEMSEAIFPKQTTFEGCLLVVLDKFSL